MKISFDTNAWENIFKTGDLVYAPIRRALLEGRFQGFICEAAFQIEAIRKNERAEYFTRPRSNLSISISAEQDGRINISAIIQPDDKFHPGIPIQQEEKLNAALASNVLIMRSVTWLGLPSPLDAYKRDNFVCDSDEERDQRDQCRSDLASALNQRQVGRYDFEQMGGWQGQKIDASGQKKFNKACAEWADGELLISHICYQNDILCTDDRANATGSSVFDQSNREWLKKTYDVKFMGLEQLLKLVEKNTDNE